MKKFAVFTVALLFMAFSFLFILAFALPAEENLPPESGLAVIAESRSSEESEVFFSGEISEFSDFSAEDSSEEPFVSGDFSIMQSSDASGAKYPDLGPVMIDAPFISQLPDWPTGCESVSAVMALNYYGFDITVSEFINNYLPKSPPPRTDSRGVTVAQSPWDYYIGDPSENGGFGCYSTVIERAINSFFDGSGTAKSVTGTGVAKLCEEYVANGQPVILWVTSVYRGDEMLPAEPGAQWYNTETDELFVWRKNEHCMLLIGYDDDYFYFNDPLRGGQTRYTRESVEAAYASLYGQAVVISAIGC